MRRPALCLAILFLALLPPRGWAKTKKKHSKSDREVRHWRSKCDVELADVPDDCAGPGLDRENCVMRCMSEACWQQHYSDDPLEEGEINRTKELAFKKCCREEAKRRKYEGKEMQQSSEL